MGAAAPARTVFSVTVAQPNRNPTVDPIAPVTLNVGATVNVGFTASDPDGDLLSNPVAVSDNGGIAGAFVSQMGTITLTANAPGTANITVSVEDGRGGTGSTVFTVTVVQPNRNPTVDPIAPVTLNVGATVNVGFTASDPDGDLLSNPVAVSDNGGIVARSSRRWGQSH